MWQEKIKNIININQNLEQKSFIKLNKKFFEYCQKNII